MSSSSGAAFDEYMRDYSRRRRYQGSHAFALASTLYPMLREVDRSRQLFLRQTEEDTPRSRFIRGLRQMEEQRAELRLFLDFPIKTANTKAYFDLMKNDGFEKPYLRAYKDSLLVKACEYLNVELVQFLLEQGFNPNEGALSGKPSALITAVSFGAVLSKPERIAIARLLIQFGADIYYQGGQESEKFSARKYAKRFGLPEIVSVIDERHHVLQEPARTRNALKWFESTFKDFDSSLIGKVSDFLGMSNPRGA